MASQLIKHLKRKVTEDEALKILENQWGFDEKLIPKALQSVGNLFTHFSLHDESHSIKILTNIERFLGQDRIKLLTATDTWLLLEAAYWHDIGMVVTAKDYREAINDIEFKSFLQEFIDNPNHELHDFCNGIIKNNGNWFQHNSTPIEDFEKFKHLFAEWFRRKHSKRANDIVLSPWEHAGISSPRTELIPKRLFKILGQICQSHGCDFELLKSDKGLPFKEVGIATEDCHPRYVACLLRLGDLLDIDDNRFCPVMLMQAGQHIPQISQHHQDKHDAIQHFRLDPERIEITSICGSIDSYVETHRWFDWIKNEIHNQMSYWQEVAPSRELGLLPTLGNLKVELNNNGQQVLFTGKRPQFELDKKQAISLLQDVYSDPLACLKELIQNAVDATLIRASLNKKVTSNEAFNISIYDDLYIDIYIDSKVIDGKEECFLKIKDNGTGISFNDFKYMLKIGGSSKNTNRRRIIESMPEWMKPSGNFGIGFQSVFLLSDQVRIKTKNIFDNQTINATLHDPTGKSEGLALITLEHNSEFINDCYGTEIEMKINSQVLKNIDHRYHHEFIPFIDRYVDNFHPHFNELSSPDALRLAFQITQITENNILKIRTHINTPDVIRTIENDNNDNNDNWEVYAVGDYIFRLSVDDIYVSNNMEHERFGRFNDQSRFLYRGQLSNDRFFLPLDDLKIKIDMLSQKANYWLTSNRENIRSHKFDEIIDLALKTIPKHIEKHPICTQSKYFIALGHHNIINEYPEWKNLIASNKKFWKKLKVSKTETIADILKHTGPVILSILDLSKPEEEHYLDHYKSDYIYHQGNTFSQIHMAMIKKIINTMEYSFVDNNTIIINNGDTEQSLHNELIAKYIFKILNSKSKDMFYYPLANDYRKYSNIASIKNSYTNFYSRNIFDMCELIILPYYFDKGQKLNIYDMDFFIKKILEKKYIYDSSFEKITSDYSDLVSKIDSIMNNSSHSSWWQGINSTNDTAHAAPTNSTK